MSSDAPGVLILFSLGTQGSPWWATSEARRTSFLVDLFARGVCVSPAPTWFTDAAVRTWDSHPFPLPTLPASPAFLEGALHTPQAPEFLTRMSGYLPRQLLQMPVSTPLPSREEAGPRESHTRPKVTHKPTGSGCQPQAASHTAELSLSPHPFPRVPALWIFVSGFPP